MYPSPSRYLEDIKANLSSTDYLKHLNKAHDNSAVNDIQANQNVIYLDLNSLMTNVMLIPLYFKQAMILNDRIIDEEIVERLLLHNTMEQPEEILAKPKLIS